MAAYYRTIKGKTYDKSLLDAADKSVRGKGDGRISLSDAKKIFALVNDSGGYSDTEKRTMQYIRDNYDFTPESDKWFRGEIRKWAASKTPAVKAKPKTVASRKPATAKKASARKPAARRPDRGPVYEEALTDSGLPAARFEPGPEKKAGGMGTWLKILLAIIVIVAIMAVIMILSPKCREQLKDRFIPAGTPVEQPPATVIEPAAQAPAPAPPDQEEPPAAPAADEAGLYTVQVKDDLVTISEKKLGESARWKEIYNANRDIIKNPTLIFPGQKLRIPEK